MIDLRYNSPQYDSEFRKIYPFMDEFADGEHFFIQLTYYIAKDLYKSRKGKRIDWGLRGFNGRSIFLDAIRFGELRDMPKKDVRVVLESVQPCADEFQGLYRVEETYGYEITLEHFIYDSVPIYGYLNDFFGDEDIISSDVVIESNAQHELYTDFYNTTLIEVEDGTKFKVGDRVVVRIYARYAKADSTGGAEMPIYATTYFTCGEGLDVNGATANTADTLPQIVSIRGNVLEIQSFRMDKNRDWPNDSNANLANDVSEQYFFESGLKGYNPPTSETFYYKLWPTMGVVYKSYEVRQEFEMFKTVLETVSYSFEEPKEIPEYIYPKRESGEKMRFLGRSTIPTIKEWLAKCAAGEKFVYTSPQFEYNGNLGMYELRVRRTECT